MNADKPSEYWLTLIETGGNQNHIFSTNKLAQNIGASQQLWAITQEDLLAIARNGKWLPELKTIDDIRCETKNPPIELCDPAGKPNQLEVWYLSSGKALLLTRSRAVAREIVSAVTRKALRDYPGVVVRGAIYPVEAWTAVGLNDAVRAVHQKMESHKNRLIPAESRFQTLPFVQPCVHSGLPASLRSNQSVQLDDPKACSTIVHKKLAAADDGRERMNKLLPAELQFSASLSDLDNCLSFERLIAVIHADGTGIGKLLQELAPGYREDPRSYLQKLRLFSMSLDNVARKACTRALEELAKLDPRAALQSGTSSSLEISALPLIVGGDDITIVIKGELALSFVKLFLEAWERLVQDCADIADIAKKVYGVSRIGMAVGIAVVKPHFPFSMAYELAEQLASSAKQRVRTQAKMSDGHTYPLSVFDFHIHRASSLDDLSEMRSELKVFEEVGSGESKVVQTTNLWGGPYVVTSLESERMDELNSDRRATLSKWAAAHSAKGLFEVVDAVQQENDDGMILPSSQLHELRSALFEGPTKADEYLNLIKARYNVTWENVLSNGSLFQEDSGGTEKFTRLLDAISLTKLRLPKT